MFFKWISKIILALLISGFVSAVSAQGLAINSSHAAASGSAMLDVSSTSKGALLPRMSKLQRNAIASPATGLLVYQVDSTPGFYYFTGAGWVGLATPSALQLHYAVFKSSGTFTTSANITTATVFKVTVTGGGGGGGGWSATPSSVLGGSAGATSIGWLSGLNPNTPYPVVVGTGGNAGTGSTTVGTIGGTSSFLSLTATGGSPGGTNTAFTAPGSTATGGTLNMGGGSGNGFKVPSMSFPSPPPAVGGGSYWGGEASFGTSFGTGGTSASSPTAGQSGIVVLEWVE